MRWLALLLIIGGLLWIRSVPHVFRESGLVGTAELRPIDEAEALIKRFGKPLADVAEPAPAGAEPTRVLTYPQLRIVFARRSSAAGPVWRIVGFVDPRTREALSGEEALRRLLAAGDSPR